MFVLIKIKNKRETWAYWSSCRVFANGPGDWSSIFMKSHTKDSKNGT